MATTKLAQSSTVVLEVALLGPLTIRRTNGEQIELPRKVRALFAYLLTRKGSTVPRQTLLGLFWGDRAEEQARSSLRQALNVLRTTLDDLADAVLVTTKESVSIEPDSVRTDLDGLEDAEASSEETLPLTLEFLEGLSLGEAPFEEWLREERERVWAKLIAQQKEMARADQEAGRYGQCRGAHSVGAASSADR